LNINDIFHQIFTSHNFQNSLYLFVIGIVISYFFIAFWKRQEFISNTSVQYDGEQRVHKGEVSRWGGLMIFLSLMIFYHFIDDTVSSSYRYLLYMISPFMLISFVEDTLHNVNFKIRLVFMIFTALIINIYWIDTFPIIENIPFISYFLQFPVLTTLFFTFALVGLMNGANFIDGMNGLATFFFMGALCGCITLAFIVKDFQAIAVIIPWIVLMICFLIFNFPFGKLFLGDSGAYLMAILIGTWIIDFFSRHHQVSSWNAVLILIYPVLEVLYSVIRKYSQGKSPFYPDRHHLHIKIYDMVCFATKKPLYANNITTVFLAIFWLTPALMVQFVYSSQKGIAICIILLVASYILINLSTPSIKKNKGKTSK